MARDFNQNRCVNAILGQRSLNRFGKVFASEFGLDGFSIITITATPAPTEIKNYLEGDTTIEIFPVAENVSKLCTNALTSFPNIETLYLFKTDSVVVLEDNLSYLSNLTKIYVQPSLLEDYQNTYTSIASLFDTWAVDYTLTIPYVVGMTELTSEYADLILRGTSSVQKNAFTKIVVDSDFPDDEIGSLDFIFDNAETPNVVTVDVDNGILPMNKAFLISQDGLYLEVE